MQEAYNLALRFLPELSLTALTWITYCYTLKCGFVSDDLMGIAEYDGKRQGLEYGMVSRWIRYHICGGNFPSKHRFQDKQSADGKTTKGTFIPCGKVASRHHILSITVFNLAILSLYYLLSNLLGQKLSFLTCLLFVVHPVVTQGVAWISGLGYPLSLFWITLSLNLSLWYYTINSPPLIVTLLILMLFSAIQVLAINALFIALASWIILIFLGHYPFALIAFLISLMEGLKIVKHTISIRTNEFKKQNMDKSTYLKPRKVIVAIKTFLYYLKHILFPNKMGLYHKWGYHYDAAVEREDRYLFIGIIAIIGLIAWFFLTPVFAIKLGIIWFVAFIFIFLNWITIQQFVTERYAMVPAIGICIILSYFLQDYIQIYTFIFGCYLVRTWLHLPTYDNELRFYQSNTWNFSDSEVALGNLGVTNIRIGRIGTALDNWQESIQVNTEYDVPYYNLYSHHKSNAMFHVQKGNFQYALDLLKQAYPYLEKCVSCEICHFKDDWTKELNEVNGWIKNPMTLVLHEEARLIELRRKLSIELCDTSDSKRRSEIIPSLNDIEITMKSLTNIKSSNPGLVYESRPVTGDSLLKSLLNRGD